MIIIKKMQFKKKIAFEMWPQLQQWWDVRKWRQISLPLKTKVFFLLLRLLQPPSEANLDIRLRFNVPRVKTLWKSVEAQIGGEQRSSIASCHRSLSAEIPRWTWAAMFRWQIDHILHCVNCLFVFLFFFFLWRTTSQFQRIVFFDVCYWTGEQ